ncbi:2-oxoacid:ferredoxin oxidoreductase subunit beta [Candidatus Shapirobacteria bacterium]|nr:2-oxoacid:ferredoxin oxidoreductase subunit beta [Candidatus Shapirobacteria bacterium]
MSNLSKYQTGKIPTWCSGCGNFLLISGLQKCFADQNIDTENIVAVYDIGCAGNMADFIHAYGLHTLHGRVVPVAMGVKLYNPKLTVLCIGGDGGIYGEGLNHLITAARANIDLKVFVSNNFLYSLTTGQTSPTTPYQAKTKSTPQGSPLIPLRAIELIKKVNPKVFAKTATNQKPKELFAKIKQAMEFKGFALLDIETECVAFGKQLKQ